MKKTLLLLALSSLPTFAQIMEVPDYVENRKPMGGPITLPISVDEQGRFEINKSAGTDFNFRPVLHLAYKKFVMNYSAPVRGLSEFSFQEIEKSQNWIEVKSRRMEYGLGVSATEVIKMGILPFKGSYQITTRFKQTEKDILPKSSLPKELSELSKWTIGDKGFYQTSGGIQVYGSFGVGIVSIAAGGVGIQNQFIINLSRLSEDKVKLTLAEENADRRQLTLGPAILEGSVLEYKSKLFNAEFILELNNLEHHTLYRQALKGHITKLQKALPHSAQRITWQGFDKSLYVGIPFIVGQVNNSSHYDFSTAESKESLDIVGKRTKGFFTKDRNHQKFLFQDEKSIILVWNSEMEKVNGKVFSQRFLSIGRMIGARGFDIEVNPETKYGKLLTDFAMGFSKKEFLESRTLDFSTLTKNLQDRCAVFARKCARADKALKIITAFKKAVSLDWNDGRRNFGFAFMNEPALIHAFIKTKGAEKQAYFKFLSEKHQSQEGVAEVEI